MRKRPLWWEISIVLGLSLGASAAYSIVSIIARLTAETSLGSQSTTLNGSRSEREWLDFTLQFLDVFFGLFIVGLAIFLLWRPRQSGFARIGLNLRRPGSDVLRGLGLVLAVGVPGLVLYGVGRMLGITVAVSASPLDPKWWTIPILVFAALKAALVEEVIVVGYLFTRLRELGWRSWTIILSAAVLRGSYHLYQGIGPFFGNVAMGVIFGWCYQRWGRVGPLVVAHWAIDIISFVGYPLALSWFPGLLAPTDSS